MKTFEQYHESRQIADFLIENSFNANEFCNILLELAEQNQLNENKLANWIRGTANWLQPKEKLDTPLTKKQIDLKTSAGVMQDIQNIDNKLKALGYNIKLSNLTFGAVEKAMAKWSEISHRGDDPYAVRASVMQRKAAERERLRNNPSQTILPKYDPSLYNTTTSMPANAIYQSNIGSDYEDTLNHSVNTNDKLKDVLGNVKKTYGNASIPGKTRKKQPKVSEIPEVPKDNPWKLSNVG